MVDECDEFNAARILLLASIVLASLALLVQFFVALHVALPTTLALSFGLSLLGGAVRSGVDGPVRGAG